MVVHVYLPQIMYTVHCKHSRDKSTELTWNMPHDYSGMYIWTCIYMYLVCMCGHVHLHVITNGQIHKVCCLIIKCFKDVCS